MSRDAILKAMADLADPRRAEVSRRFFKTGPGEYGEGDVFIGLAVPKVRALSKAYRHLAMADVLRLLKSKIHEERQLALFIWVLQFPRADEKRKKLIFDNYLAHTAFINNWDLVDASAEYIVGAFLNDRPKKLLLDLARSSSLWERRIAMLATFGYIKAGAMEWPLKIATRLLEDKEDLIHKAVGWMLREIGSRDPKAEQAFLKEHYRTMPRTMLRYAIEKFPAALRRKYLEGKV